MWNLIWDFIESKTRPFLIKEGVRYVTIGLGLLFAWLTSKGVQSLPTPDPATVTTVVTGAVTVLLAVAYTVFNWIHNRAAAANRDQLASLTSHP